MTKSLANVFDGLSAPKPGTLTIYVIGPGYGESQVVALPDGRWMVVDCCRYDGVHWTVELLRHLEVKDVDLFCLTHPDEDHYKGVPEGAPLVRSHPYPRRTPLYDIRATHSTRVQLHRLCRLCCLVHIFYTFCPSHVMGWWWSWSPY